MAQTRASSRALCSLGELAVRFDAVRLTVLRGERDTYRRCSARLFHRWLDLVGPNQYS